jgi:ubiquinone/menaquinone biosynthesis C-methylase UbiE
VAEPDLYERLVARNYDASYAVSRDPSGDARFYRELAHELGGAVLELGCGTGRILLPIARDGIECVGLDSSAAMLEVLREKQPPANLRLVEGRMERFDLGTTRFRLITCPFRAFSHLLDTDAQLTALARVKRHLAPGGVFAFDVFYPRPENLARDEDPECLSITFHGQGRELQRWDTVRRDRSRQILSVRFRYAGGPPEITGSVEMQLRWFHRFELEHLLARSGFGELTFFRDFDRTPWSAGQETVVLARVGP